MRYVSPGRDEKQGIRLHDAYQRISGWTKPLILGLGALLTLIVTVLSVPPTTVDLSEIRSNLPVTVDASWAIGLVALAQQGLVSGRDFYFNYGPLAQGVAWLSAHMNIYGSVLDALPLILLGFFLLNTLLFTLILVLIPQVSGRHSLIIYLVLHLLNSVFALDMTFRPFMVLLFSIVMAYAMRQSTRARSLGLAGLAGIVSLMAQLLTVELGVISIAVSVAVLGFYTLLSLQPSLLGKPDLHSPHRYALILATILAVFVAGNLILGLSFKLTAPQAIGWFDYQRAMLDIMRGYNYTMGTIWAFSSFESRGAAVLISAISVYILLGLRRMQTADGYLLVSLLAASLLLLKGAIVRSDPHHIMLGLTGFALLFLLLWHNWAGLARGRWIHLAVWVGLLGLLLRIWPTAGWASLSRLGSVLKGQVTPIAQYQRLTTAYTPTHLLMPAGLVTSNEPGPVLNFPYENYIGIAAGRPLIAPVLQSYAAHTEALQRYYIQSLERAPRPLDVTYSLDGIVVAAVDGVQQVTRVPIIFDYLYRHFELASTHSFGGIYRLRRRDHPAEMLSTPVAYKVQHTSGPQLRLATALPTQCSLVRLHVKLNYPVTSSLGRPNGVEVAFFYQGIPIHRSNLVAIEAGHTFVTYISLIDAH